MIDKNSKTQPDTTQWMALSLRLTAFPSPSTPINSSDWWATIVGDLPESQENNPKVGKKRETGSFENGNLVLAIQPGRIDWSFTSPKDHQLDLPTSQEDLMNLQPMLNSFLRITNHWLEIAPPLLRIAFGTHLGIPVGSREDGYNRIAKYLKPYVELDTKNSSEFFYQINRPRVSASIPTVKLNRLSKWSVSVASTGEIMILQGEKLARGTMDREFFSCHLELDINTASDNTNELEHQSLLAVFAELVQLGQEIAEKGDIP